MRLTLILLYGEIPPESQSQSRKIVHILVHYLRTFSIDLSKNHDVSEEFERSYGWRVFGKDSGGWISYIKKSRNKRK